MDRPVNVVVLRNADDREVDGQPWPVEALSEYYPQRHLGIVGVGNHNKLNDAMAMKEHVAWK